MDFSELLGLAQENQGVSKVKPAKFLSTKVEAAKKNPRQKKLSENVRKFMERREAEDKAKRKEAAKNTANLLEMRKTDKRSTRTMNSMLQRTKSANRAVIADAVNRRDTADTLTGGRNQCDEDDYGYESAAAKKLFENLMTTYEKDPTDPMDRFTKSGNLKKTKPGNLGNTVARVKNSLEVEEAEANGPRKRRSKASSSSSSKATSSSMPSSSASSSSASSSFRSKDDKSSGTKGKRSAEEEARRRRLAMAKKAPPPVAFSDLMKMASKKSQEPVKIDKVKEVAEFGRPMSAKQKEEYIRERNSHLRKIGKLPPETAAKPLEKAAAGGVVGEKKASGQISRDNHKEVGKKVNNNPPPPEKKKPVIQGPEFHPAVLKSKKIAEERAKAAAKMRPKPKPQPSSSSKQSDLKRKREEQYERSRSPSPIRGSGSRAKALNRIDSESEDEDSEMDDFIDDTDCKMDISKEIQSIFGYNRSRYRDEPDFDDRSMENNRFSDVMKEEARSARIGLQEDLEDMRMEEEEKKRKKMKKKR